MESGSSLLSMVNSGQVGRALKVYGSWQCEMYWALERVSGRSARRRADRASVTRVEMRFWRCGGLRGAGQHPTASRQRHRGGHA